MKASHDGGGSRRTAAIGFEKLMVPKVAVWCLAGLLAATPVAAQKAPDAASNEQFTLSVDVEFVVFNLTVVDNRMRPVSGLKVQDFHIYEDGVEQRIQSLHAEDAPATVGLVIDNSASMAPKRNDVVSAAMEFVSSSNPADEIFIVHFGEYIAIPLFKGSAAFTSNYEELREALFRTAAVGRTALYDGIAIALKRLEGGSHLRKALVVLSDGGDNISTRTLNQVTQLAAASTATIFTIGVYDASGRDQNPKVLRELSKLTGGEFHHPQTSAQLHDIWKKIAGGIRSQYTMGYVSTNTTRDGAFRKVKIVASDRNGKALDVQTRAGYTAPVTHGAAPAAR